MFLFGIQRELFPMHLHVWTSKLALKDFELTILNTLVQTSGLARRIRELLLSRIHLFYFMLKKVFLFGLTVEEHLLTETDLVFFRYRPNIYLVNATCEAAINSSQNNRLVKGVYCKTEVFW